MRIQLLYQWMSAFFGLDPSDREKILLEPFYLLNQHLKGGMDWNTYINFFVSYRIWLLNRIKEDLTEQAKQMKERQQGQQLVHNGQAANLPSGGPRKF